MSNASTPARVVFGGQYSTFNEVYDAYPAVKPYNSASSLGDQIANAKRKLAGMVQGVMPDSAWGNCRESILLSLLSTLERKSVRVLDVGGGFGALYISLKISCPQVNVDYTILELKETVEAAANLFKDYKDIKFIDQLPRPETRFDVVIFGSSLQYFEEYESILKQVLNYKPEFLMLLDHPMGPAKTFVCAQLNMVDRVIPMMVFNVNEIIEILSKSAYGLQLKSISHYPFHTFANYENEVSRSRYYNLIFRSHSPS